MILPISVTQYCETWNGLDGGTSRLNTGNTMNSTAANAPSAVQPRIPYRREIVVAIGPMRLRLGCAPFEREQSLRPALDEDDDEYEHRDLGDHRPRPSFEELVREAERQRRVDGARQLPDPAEHDHHERIDDVALPEIGPDVADLRERAPGEPGDPRAEAERERIDPRSRHADAGRHLAVLRHAAHEE